MIEAFIIHAQYQEVPKTVLCSDTPTIMDRLVEEYKETPLWASKLEDSTIVLMVNPTTKTWTILQYDKKTTCVIDAGKGYINKIPGPST